MYYDNNDNNIVLLCALHICVYVGVWYTCVCVYVCEAEWVRSEESLSLFHSAIVTVEFPTTTTYG